MASVRPELGLLNLPAAQIESLLNLQLRAQQAEYLRVFPAAQSVLVLAGSTLAGRFWVDRGEREFRVLDISLLPEYRRRGIGSWLYQEFLAEAQSLGQPVRCSVSRFNPVSQQFHAHLGFQVIAENEMELHLERL